MPCTWHRKIQGTQQQTPHRSELCPCRLSLPESWCTGLWFYGKKLRIKKKTCLEARKGCAFFLNPLFRIRCPIKDSVSWFRRTVSARKVSSKVFFWWYIDLINSVDKPHFFNSSQTVPQFLLKLIRSFSWHLICSVFTRHTISRRKQPSLLVRATERKMAVWRMERSGDPLSTPCRMACYIDRKNTPAWYGKKTATHNAVKSGTVTYPICDNSLSRSARRSPASLQKCVKKALSDMVLVQVQRLSGIAST